MKKLTKKQRYEIYERALDGTLKRENTHSGICWLIERTSNIWIYDNHIYTHKNSKLPELWCFIDKCYPKLNWKERKMILQFCIEMTK